MKKSMDVMSEDSNADAGLETFTILHRGYKKLYPILAKMEDLLIREKSEDATTMRENTSSSRPNANMANAKANP